jgi:hypothetical protein
LCRRARIGISGAQQSKGTKDMTVQTADTAHSEARPGPLKRGLDYLRELKDQVTDTGHAAPEMAQSPGLKALRLTEKTLSVPLLGLIIGIYTVLGGLIVLVFGGFLFALIAG